MIVPIPRSTQTNSTDSACLHLSCHFHGNSELQHHIKGDTFLWGTSRILSMLSPPLPEAAKSTLNYYQGLSRALLGWAGWRELLNQSQMRGCLHHREVRHSDHFPCALCRWLTISIEHDHSTLSGYQSATLRFGPFRHKIGGLLWRNPFQSYIRGIPDSRVLQRHANFGSAPSSHSGTSVHHVPGSSVIS
jgi:hypothetical protein